MRDVRARGILLSQINLTLRADWFLLGEVFLREALGLAKADENTTFCSPRWG